MKKLIYFICLMVAGYTGSAQNPVFSPSSFTAQDQVTLTFDVTGTPMAGATEAYLWLWGNAGVSPLNSNWTNSPDAARMTAAGTNKWSFTFTATVMWGLPAAALQNFQFLVKKKDGSAQTGDQGPFNFDPLIFAPTMLRIFPSKIGADDIATVNFDRAYGVTPNEQRMTPATVTITMLDDTGTQVGAPLTAAVTKVGDTRWAKSFIPSLTFTPATGRKLTKFKYKFNGTLLDPSGATITVTSSEAEVTFTLMQ
ncbi:MAG TPA: hypothetical protein VGO58_20155 [Chitinophagaceae bacterium]|jgi:hypothetical protein|nr:hypothetical protein [Chitinophagaceae bacterium]